MKNFYLSPLKKNLLIVLFFCILGLIYSGYQEYQKNNHPITQSVVGTLEEMVTIHQYMEGNRIKGSDTVEVSGVRCRVRKERISPDTKVGDKVLLTYNNYVWRLNKIRSAE